MTLIYNIDVKTTFGIVGKTLKSNLSLFTTVDYCQIQMLNNFANFANPIGIICNILRQFFHTC